MPIPKPSKKQKQKGDKGKKEFLSNCMSKMASEFPDQAQRYAVCQSQWKNRNKKKSKSSFGEDNPFFIAED